MFQKLRHDKLSVFCELQWTSEVQSWCFSFPKVLVDYKQCGTLDGTGRVSGSGSFFPFDTKPMVSIFSGQFPDLPGLHVAHLVYIRCPWPSHGVIFRSACEDRWPKAPCGRVGKRWKGIGRLWLKDMRQMRGVLPASSWSRHTASKAFSEVGWALTVLLGDCDFDASVAMSHCIPWVETFIYICNSQRTFAALVNAHRDWCQQNHSKFPSDTGCTFGRAMAWALCLCLCFEELALSGGIGVCKGLRRIE